MSTPVRWLAAALSALVLVGGVAAPLCAQSLADLAKKEEERRKAIKEPSKTYTNKDLANLPPVTASTTPMPEIPKSGSADGSKTAEADKTGDKTKDGPKDAAPARDQKYWSGRLKELQTQLERDQSFAEALQSRINALWTDFVARDDPAQKAVIAQNRTKALAELDRLKLAIVNDKKAVADLQEEARKSGVPPGWLR